MEECVLDLSAPDDATDSHKSIFSGGMEMDDCLSKDGCSSGKSTTNDG